MAKSISRVTDYIVRQETVPPSVVVPTVDTTDVTLDRISKLHALIDQVQMRVDRLEAEGKETTHLETSLTIYQRRLHEYEMRLQLE